MIKTSGQRSGRERREKTEEKLTTLLIKSCGSSGWSELTICAAESETRGRRRATRAAPKAAPCIVAVAAAVERSEGSEGERRERENRQMGN